MTYWVVKKVKMFPLEENTDGGVTVVLKVLEAMCATSKLVSSHIAVAFEQESPLKYLSQS